MQKFSRPAQGPLIRQSLTYNRWYEPKIWRDTTRLEVFLHIGVKREFSRHKTYF